MPTLRTRLPEAGTWSISETMHGRVEQFAETQPQKIALKSRHGCLTYADLNDRANHLAQQIHAVVPPRSFVAAITDDTLYAATAMIAISKAGCGWLPVESRLPSALQSDILASAEAAAFVVDAAHLETAQALNSGQPIFTVEWSHGKAPTNLNLTIEPDDPFYLFFTSGSTGKPKGAFRSHLRYWRAFANAENLERHHPDDTILTLGSMNHAGGSLGVRMGLFIGASIHVLDPKDETAESVADWIAREQVGAIFTIPSLFRTLFARNPKTPLHSVRLIRLTSEPILAADLDLFKRTFPPGNVTLMNYYASTEAAGVGYFYATHDTQVEGATLPAGKSSGVEVWIEDSAGSTLPDGEVGEIIVRTAYASDGYWKDPVLTAQFFTPDPADPSIYRVRTGDIGKFLPDGNLIQLGRVDAMVKIRGFRVELLAIENLLRQHPQIDAGTVRAITEDGVSRLIAYVVTREGVALASAQIRDYLGKHLPDFMLPSQVIFLDSMPLLPSGKIDTAALPPPVPTASTSAPAQTPTETQLEKLFLAVLPVHSIGRTDHFFDMGGDSLRAMQLVAALNVQFRTMLTPAALYAHPTLEALAAYIDTNDKSESPLVALNPYGNQPLLIGLPGAHGNALVFRTLVSHLGADYPVSAFQFPRQDEQHSKFRSMQQLAHNYLEAVKQQLPDRPFYLIGDSLGGVVALEMAQQLSAAGTPPLGLILLDSPLYNRGEWKNDRDDAPTLAAKVAEEISRFRVHLYVWKRFIQKSLTTNLQKRTNVLVTQELIALSRHYRVKPYDGSIFYFSCRKDRRIERSTRETSWARLAAGTFEITDISGQHHTMLSEPHVAEVARHIRRIMQETKRTE